MVGEGGELVGQPPGLVAEQPRGGPGEQVVGLVEVDLAGAVGGQDHEPGRLGGAYGGRGIGLDGDRQVEEAADRGPHRLGVVRVDRVAGEHDRVGSGRVGAADHGARVAGVADVGADREEGGLDRLDHRDRRLDHRRPAGSTTDEAARPPSRSRTWASGRSRNRATATTPAGFTLSLSEASARSSTSVHAGAAAARAAYCRVASGVANTSTTQPGTPRAPSTALGPSARNSRSSARNERRASFRAFLTRVFPLVSGVGSAGKLAMSGLGSGLRRTPRPWAR